MQHGSDTPVVELIDEFLAARAVRKPSEHTLQAYRRDLTLILGLATDGPVDQVLLGVLSPRLLRGAFARFAAGRAPASVYRAWSSQ